MPYCTCYCNGCGAYIICSCFNINTLCMFSFLLHKKILEGWGWKKSLHNKQLSNHMCELHHFNIDSSETCLKLTLCNLKMNLYFSKSDTNISKSMLKWCSAMCYYTISSSILAKHKKNLKYIKSIFTRVKSILKGVFFFLNYMKSILKIIRTKSFFCVEKTNKLFQI